MKFEIFVFDKVLIESLFDRFWFFFINKTKRIKEEIDQDPFFLFFLFDSAAGKGSEWHVTGRWEGRDRKRMLPSTASTSEAQWHVDSNNTNVGQARNGEMILFLSSTYFTSFICLHDGTRQSTSSTSHPIIDRSWWLFDRVIESNLPPIKKRHVYWPSHKV